MLEILSNQWTLFEESRVNCAFPPRMALLTLRPGRSSWKKQARCTCLIIFTSSSYMSSGCRFVIAYPSKRQTITLTYDGFKTKKFAMQISAWDASSPWIIWSPSKHSSPGSIESRISTSFRRPSKMTCYSGQLWPDHNLSREPENETRRSQPTGVWPIEKCQMNVWSSLNFRIRCS